MLDLPHEAEGLAWIASHGPTKLLLLPGLRAFSITAAAEGSQQALAYLRFKAQEHAGSAGNHILPLYEAFRLSASQAGAQSTLQVQSDMEAQVECALHARQEAIKQTLLLTAGQGQLAALKWLRALCRPIDEPGLEVMQAAARHGHLEILQYLRSGPSPAPWDYSVSFNAAPHFDCLTWLLTQDPPCPCHDDLPHQVALWGSLDSLMWLKAHAPNSSVHWRTTASAAAVCRNDLEMLQWLQAMDCPCDHFCCIHASEAGNVSMLQWLCSQQPPCPWDGECTLKATAHGHLSTLRWLCAQDPPCPWASLWPCTHEAAERGNLAVLELLCDQGLMLTCTEYYWAASEGHRHVLSWLHAQGTPIPSPSFREMDCISSTSVPFLMFLGDIDVPLLHHEEALIMARQTFCTFHGLLRWCCRAVSDPSRCAARAFDLLAPDCSSQELLVRLSRLPSDLIAVAWQSLQSHGSRIAVAAELQHDILG